MQAGKSHFTAAVTLILACTFVRSSLADDKASTGETATLECLVTNRVTDEPIALVEVHAVEGSQRRELGPTGSDGILRIPPLRPGTTLQFQKQFYVLYPTEHQVSAEDRKAGRIKVTLIDNTGNANYWAELYSDFAGQVARNERTWSEHWQWLERSGIPAHGLAALALRAVSAMEGRVQAPGMKRYAGWTSDEVSTAREFYVALTRNDIRAATRELASLKKIEQLAAVLQTALSDPSMPQARNVELIRQMQVPSDDTALLSSAFGIQSDAVLIPDRCREDNCTIAFKLNELRAVAPGAYKLDVPGISRDIKVLLDQYESHAVIGALATRPSRGPTMGNRTLGLTLAGAGASISLGALTATLFAHNKAAEARFSCYGQSNCGDRALRQSEEAVTIANVATIAAMLGGGVMAAGIAILLLDDSGSTPAADPPAATRLGIKAEALGDAGAVSLIGAF